MQHFGLFDDKIIHRFNFQGEYVGYVLDNSEFEDTLKIKVFVPELFGYNYTPAIKNIDNTVEISTSHLFNKNDINITTQINKQEYIYARIMLDKADITGTKESFLKEVRPEIGEKVIVYFFNNNPTNCVYENKLFLTDGESLEITEDKTTASKIIKIINEEDSKKKATTDKIVWQYFNG
ncbi:MAG TPA: hypothetical protein PK507_02105 [bacterium]|nr:hypothetical protein [bacterium]